MLAKPTCPVIVDYGSGNLRSVVKAFEFVNGGNLIVSNEPSEFAAASHIILPGVGAFGACKAGLSAIPGLIAELTEQVIEKKKPFLGICVGMHLMATLGLEHGKTPGLDWISGSVVKIKSQNNKLKIPHMGWNELIFSERTHPVLRDFENGAHAYFIHSYYFDAANHENVLANVDYGSEITTIIAKNNLIGTQFHPEKSQNFGLAFIKNFLKWDGS